MIKQKGPLLVIKLGALGDFVLATGPFAAIRAAHPNEVLVLLTTAPFAEFARASGYFDEVWIDANALKQQNSRITAYSVPRQVDTLNARHFFL